MGSLNIASLFKHFDELQVFMEEEPFDVLAINETRLDSSILDCSVSLPGYNLLRRDRNRNGGGVCVYIRKTIELNISLTWKCKLLK
jgi:exonuclease III